MVILMENRRQTKHQKRPPPRQTRSHTFNVVGFPDDLGIQNVGGRLGAKEGPREFWAAFQKLKGPACVLDRLRVYSEVKMKGDLELNHLAAASQVRQLCLKHPLDRLLVVGGGHDYAYSWIKGLVESRKKGSKIACINIDAHLDVREYSQKMTSGSPFRRLIDERWLSPQGLVEFGIQSHCNAPELMDWVHAKKIGVVPFEKLRNQKSVITFKNQLKKLRRIFDEVVISVDLDALSFAFAPGVSAPQAEGFTSSELFEMLEFAGADNKVTSIGFFELSPPLDFQNHTSRLAAQAAWHFLAAQ